MHGQIVNFNSNFRSKIKSFILYLSICEHMIPLKPRTDTFKTVYMNDMTQNGTLSRAESEFGQTFHSDF